jgi:secreted PhoX family phosphatase
MTTFDRRAFLRRGLAVTGGLSISGPLLALVACTEPARQPSGSRAMVDMGELALPKGFRFRIVSRQEEEMSDGMPTPSRFDGMAAFPAPGGATILVRNHENKGESGEVEVAVAAESRYDASSRCNGGVTKLVVTPERSPADSFAVLGGTSHNCAGGSTPWHSWISCEEVFDDDDEPHGYAFEVDAGAEEPVAPQPITSAGRFVHEAVAWQDGILYETEDQHDSAFYRFVPDETPSAAGNLAAMGGELQALKIVGEEHFGASTSGEWPIGEGLGVEWVTIEDPDPSTDVVRDEAHDNGAAVFARGEGACLGDGKIYFNCTDGGRAERGQIWELDPRAERLTLVYESPGADQLNHPDNLVLAHTGDLFICEDNDAEVHVRRLTPEGKIFDFARALADETSEFTGVCFDPSGRTMFVNQQGDPSEGLSGVTYAIWGPWETL